MSDSTRTEADLVDEISVLKKKIRELERIQEDQKRIEADLRLSHERLRLLIDGGPDFFFLKDGELRYRLVNRANAAFFRVRGGGHSGQDRHGPHAGRGCSGLPGE